jgi:hypothetical protein
MVDKELLKSARIGQGCRPRRCSIDKARRQWYARRRTERLAKLGR